MENNNNQILFLADMVERRANNFDLLRLGAALVVLISHSFILAGKPSQSWSRIFFGFEPSSLAVYAFFAISGFLIAGSLERRSAREYFQARVLRIIPALAFTAFITVFFVGPSFTNLSLQEYFTQSATYRYLLNAFPYLTVFTLPGVFQDLPYPASVNGSLWTIPIEAFCYVLLAALFLTFRKSLSFVLPVIVLMSLYFLWAFFFGTIRPLTLFGTTALESAVKFALIFMIGAAFWHYKTIIPFKGGIAAGCLVVMLMGAQLGYGVLTIYLGLPYLLLYLAYRKPVLVNGMRRLGDLSYGTYLFAFPIQQSIVQLSNKAINGWWLAIATAVLSMGLAWLSWRYIEKPAIKWKVRVITPDLPAPPQVSNRM